MSNLISVYTIHCIYFPCLYHFNFLCLTIQENFFLKNKARGPLVLYRSPECWGYVELEQTWRYMSTQCCLSFHPCRSILKQIWPCHKNSQGQPNVIIWSIGSTWVPDAVYQVSKSSASWFWRKRFLKFFTIIYMFMVMWPGTFEQIFIPHISWRLHMKFGFNQPSGRLKMLNLSDLGQSSMNDLDLWYS